MEKSDRKQLLEKYKTRKIVGGIFGIRNSSTGKVFLQATQDLQGSKNRFLFSQNTGGCTYSKLQKDWDSFGGSIFCFEVLEELEKKDNQSTEEFREDLHLLEEIWLEKLQDCLY